MRKELTKEFLADVYLKEKLSTWAIEKRYGYTRSSVYNALKRYGIPSRSIAASHVRYARTNFSGDTLEKAYLIGFAVGDLRVRQHNKAQGETISIGCGSTQEAQVMLFEELFSQYGRVWKSKPDKRGAVNMEAFVDHSFSFLLPNQRSYEWTLADEETFFAFLGGFTDAEGSFYITRGQARVAWGNYDTKVLAYIQQGLKKVGVETPKMCCDTLKGYVGSHGYRRNKNYCHVTCTKKSAILTLLDRIEPFLRHTNKRKRARQLRANIIERNKKYGP